MSDKKDYKDLSIDEKMLLLDGKLAYLDKLVDELAKGKSMDNILRK